MSRLPLRIVPLLAVLSLAAWLGCSDDSATPPTVTIAQDDADGVAQQVGALLAVDTGGALALMAGSTLTIPGKGADDTPAATAQAETTFTLGGITYTLTRTFYNLAGQEMAAYNPLLTARMVTTATAHGSIETVPYGATLGYASSLDCSGLSALQDTLRFNGAAHDTLLSRFTSLDTTRTRHFYLEAAGALADVLCLKPMTAATWPLSGTATWNVTADRLRSNDRLDVAAHFDASVVARFNGTRNVELEIEHHWTYHLDLKTGSVTRV